VTREEAIKALVDGKVVIAHRSLEETLYIKFQDGRFTYSPSIKNCHFSGHFYFLDSYSYEIYEEPKKKKTKRFWIWDVKLNSGDIIKSQFYLDEDYKTTRGSEIYKDPRALLNKHENEFIDIEVEE
jgi:hypothetical protein